MIIPTNFAQVNYQFQGTNLPTGAEWTLGIGLEGYLGDLEDLPEALTDAYGTAPWQDLMVDECALRNVKVKVGPNATGPSFERATNIPGTLTGNPTTPQVTGLIKKITDQGGRTGRGRMFLPGIPEASVEEDGLMAAGWISDAAAIGVLFRSELVAAGVVPVLLHAEGSPVTTPLVIQQFVPDARCATQRRRNRR